MRFQRRQINLSRGMGGPKCRVRSVDQAIVRNDPLSVERPEPVAGRRDARTVVLIDSPRPMLMAGKTLRRRLNDGLVAVHVRVKQDILLCRVLLAGQGRPSSAQ